MKGAIRKPRTPGGAWSYRIDLGFDDAGKRRQRQVGNFTTKRAAQAALNEALAGLQQGSYIAPSKQTVRDFLEVWIDTIKPEIALTAWTNYGEVVERYVLPHLGAIRLADLSAMDIKRWHGTLLDHGRRDGTPLAVNSVKLSHRVLHRALADGVRWNVLPTNPASSVRVPKGEHKEMTVWTSDEARRFIESLADDRLRGLWVLALHTGMRRGELAGLRWSDVDLEAATLTIAQQRTSAGNQTVTTTPKARSQRQLLLATSTVKVLRDHQERQQLERESRECGVGGVRLRVRRRGRRTSAAAASHQDVRDGDRSCRCPEDQAARCAAHDGDHGTRGRGASEGRAGTTRSRHDRGHDGHLLAHPSSRSP